MSGLKYILYFITAVLLQVLVFNHVFFLGYMNPYIYIIFLLYLPVSTSRGLLLLNAFLIGLCVDIFENSGGVHTSASLVLAYLRPAFLRLVSRRQGADFEDLKITNFGLPSMLIYSIFAIFLHHFILFMLEAFRWTDIGIVLVRTLYSSIFTLTFVLIVQLWNFRRRS
ncbi:MAG: rod shape-determining protein MreD [Owenweeksia sp.]